MAGRPKIDLTAIANPPKTLEESVRALAEMGLSREGIANYLGLSVYQVKEGQLSDAYTQGRQNAESDLLYVMHRRALDDNYKGADGNAHTLLKMVYGYRETTGIAVGDSNITLLLTPEPPSNGTTA
jgi:aryl-alcohol dehydrogenase-like predicted oxidoreductase